MNTTGDFDGDGLPDWWEMAMSLDPNDATGINGTTGDLDADGNTPTGDGATELVTIRIKPQLGTPRTPEKFVRVRVTHP